MQKLLYKPVTHKRFGTDQEITSIKTLSHGRITIDDISRKLGRSIIGISEGTIRTVIEALQNTLEEYLVGGNTVEMGIFSVSLSIRGNLEHIEDSIDIASGKHSVKVVTKPTKRLVNFLKENIQFEKDSRPNEALYIKSFKNLNTNSLDTFSPLQVCELKGYKLGLKKGVAEDGVYLVNIATEQEYKITLTTENTHRRICFYVPQDISAGTYRLLVKSTISGSPKAGNFKAPIYCI